MTNARAIKRVVHCRRRVSESVSADRGATALRLVQEPGTPRTEVEPEELNLRIFQPVFSYVREEMGVKALVDLIEQTGIPEGDLKRASAWVSAARAERLVAWLRHHVESDAEFMRANAYEMGKLYGPMSLAFRLATVRAGYEALTRTSHLATKVGKFQLVSSSRTSVRLRYTSAVAESRLMCLSRQAQQRALPMIWWNTSPAAIEEHSCIAHGDGACEYTVRWDEAFRIRGPLIGALVGGTAAFVLGLLGSIAPWGFASAACALFGLLAGTTLELRRLVAGYNRLAASMASESETMVQEHARAVDEVLALHERERRWSAHLESTLATRRARLGKVLDEFGGSNREEKLRTLSHELSNPLTVLTTTLSAMHGETATEDDAEAVTAMLQATDRLKLLVREVSTIARADTDARGETRDIVEIEALTNRIRRQLAVTLVHRDIRPSVFKTREAPTSIETEALALERVIDNILTNTCKYTERGSVVVEVSGTPGYLLLKVSDTGRGIGPERLEQVFLGGKADPNPVVGESHGAGLSIVVGLLDQLGGRLEIMSRPKEGTTIWVYVPVALPEASDGVDEQSEDTAQRFRRIVRIRPHR